MKLLLMVTFLSAAIIMMLLFIRADMPREAFGYFVAFVCLVGYAVMAGNLEDKT